MKKHLKCPLAPWGGKLLGEACSRVARLAGTESTCTDALRAMPDPAPVVTPEPAPVVTPAPAPVLPLAPVVPPIPTGAAIKTRMNTAPYANCALCH